MANIKITELNELTQIATDDVLPIVDISANETKKVSLKNVLNVELIAVTDTAPLQCSVGDKYYNTTTNKIYTAIATDTWGTTGVDAVQGVFYVVFSEQSSYSYDGNTLVSVGGGTEDIVISDEEPTEEGVKIWIDTGEIASPVSEITNSYSTSTGIGYSANYVNNMNTYSNTEVRIGTYKDKPLYRKMLEFTTPDTANTNTEVATFDTTFTVRNFYGNIDVSSTGQVLPLNFYFSNEYLVATYPENGTGKVKMKVGTNAYTSLNVDMFIEYTKTTD